MSELGILLHVGIMKSVQIMRITRKIWNFYGSSSDVISTKMAPTLNKAKSVPVGFFHVFPEEVHLVSWSSTLYKNNTILFKPNPENSLSFYMIIYSGESMAFASLLPSSPLR